MILGKSTLAFAAVIGGGSSALAFAPPSAPNGAVARRIARAWSIAADDNHAVREGSSSLHMALDSDWDNNDFLGSLGGNEEDRDATNEKYMKESAAREELTEWRAMKFMEEKKRLEEEQSQPKDPGQGDGTSGPSAEMLRKMGVGELGASQARRPPSQAVQQPPPQAVQQPPPQAVQQPPPQYFDANGNPIAPPTPQFFDANGNPVAPPQWAQQPPPQQPAAPAPYLEPPLPPTTKAKDVGARPTGFNSDAYTMSNTADVYFAQLKRDSTVRKQAWMKGDKEAANEVFTDPIVQKIKENWTDNPYTKEKNYSDARAEVVGMARLMELNDDDEEANNLSSGISYKERLAQKKGKKLGGGAASPPRQPMVVEKPPVAEVVETPPVAVAAPVAKPAPEPVVQQTPPPPPPAADMGFPTTYAVTKTDDVPAAAVATSTPPPPPPPAADMGFPTTYAVTKTDDAPAATAATLTPPSPPSVPAAPAVHPTVSETGPSAAVQAAMSAAARMAATAGGTDEEESRRKVRTLQGLLLKQRGGPGFGAGRLREPEARRLEEVLSDVTEILREEASGYTGGKLAAAVSTPPPPVVVAPVPVPAPAPVAPPPAAVPDPMAGAVAEMEAALANFKATGDMSQLLKLQQALANAPVLDAASTPPPPECPAHVAETTPPPPAAAASSGGDNTEVLEGVYDALASAQGKGKFGLGNLSGDEASDLVDKLGEMRAVLLDEL